MLSAIFNSLIEASPLSVMMRGVAERLLNPEQVDPWFEQFAQEQYTRELLFSTVVSVMLEVGCGTRQSVNAAYQAMQAAIPVSMQAGYDTRRGMEPGVAAELVRYAARDGQAVIAALAGASPAVLPGSPVRILEGNHVAATAHRRKALRPYAGGALPGQAVVVYAPDRELARDVVPGENGHAQARSLLAAVAAHLAAGQVWVMDRTFWVRHGLQRIAARPAYFVVREQEQTPFTPLAPSQETGATETGWIGEPPLQVLDSTGQPAVWRRSRGLLQRPPRDGDDRGYLGTHFPATVTAVTVARLYLKRGRIATAFPHLAQDLTTDIKPLGSPRAAWFGVCLGVGAYNSWAVLTAALRRVHGAEHIDTALSGYYVADEVSGTYRGMMIAIPPAEWPGFRHLPITALAAVLINVAGTVCLARFRKPPRGPQKPRPPRQFDPKHPHQATVNLWVNCRK